MRNIALVTGASSGMGKEFVREISKKYKGLDEIWVVARRRERLRELKKEIIGTRVRILPLDLMNAKLPEAGGRPAQAGGEPRCRHRPAFAFHQSGHARCAARDLRHVGKDLSGRAMRFVEGCLRA